MYTYVHPTPIVVPLGGQEGYELRKRAADIVEKSPAKGPQAGSTKQQSYGILAQIIVTRKLGISEPVASRVDVGYDLVLPTGVKVDVKCRGGQFPFREVYEGITGPPRDAKHNFFARQVFDNTLKTDIYLMTHLQTTGDRELPGTPRQRNWNLFICGWVSKERVIKEGVYLPPGCLTERGSRWFTYRAHEIEFYHKHLNGLKRIEDLRKLEHIDVRNDEPNPTRLHLTIPDACRILSDMIGRGILDPSVLESFRKTKQIEDADPPVFHPNQYYHLARYLLAMKTKGVNSDLLEKITEQFQEETFEGL